MFGYGKLTQKKTPMPSSSPHQLRPAGQTQIRKTGITQMATAAGGGGPLSPPKRPQKVTFDQTFDQFIRPPTAAGGGVFRFNPQTTQARRVVAQYAPSILPPPPTPVTTTRTPRIATPRPQKVDLMTLPTQQQLSKAAQLRKQKVQLQQAIKIDAAILVVLKKSLQDIQRNAQMSTTYRQMIQKFPPTQKTKIPALQAQIEKRKRRVQEINQILQKSRGF